MRPAFFACDTGNYYKNGYPNQGLSSSPSNVATVGFNLTIPLFDGFSRTYKVRGAQAQIEQSEAQLEETESQILAEVVKTHADAYASLSNLDASEKLIASAQEALASAQRRHGKGVTDILELLSAQAALADARQERIRCLAEWRSAELRLMGSAGILKRVDLFTRGSVIN